jgi:uncharacterized protein (DUF1501 family)
MIIKRREFIHLSSLATTSLMLPKFLKAFEAPRVVPEGNKVIVVVQLSGGNDGLNTVIPTYNDIYYKLRPQLGIQKQKALQLTDEAGLHTALTAFKDLYDDGSLAILNNVGYPNPDRSHFRSMDIWHTASQSNEIWQTGWVGRYLDAQCNGCPAPTQAIEVDDVLSLALKGEKEKGIATKNPKQLYNISHQPYFQSLVEAHSAVSGEEKPIDYLYKTMSQAINSANYLFEKTKQAPLSTVSYPKTEIGNNLKTIASLICSNINTKVYYVSLATFDTHVNQQPQQQRLFSELNNAIKAFVQDLKNNNRFNDVLLFTFSEFGRRVAQNASGGTDHGTANNMFFISGSLKQKGLLNELPDLTQLQEGDLRYNIDFKQVYATILHNWLAANDVDILKRKYDYLSFV